MFIVSYIVGPFGVERRGEEGRGGDVLELFATLIQALSSKKLKIKVKQIFFSRSCVTTFIKIQTKRAATKLCEILKYELKTFKEGINKKNKYKTKAQMDKLEED